MRQKVDISPIKSAAPRLPEPVRTLILTEKNELTVEELIAKVGDWERLIRMASNQK